MKERIAVTVLAAPEFSKGENLGNLGSSAAINFSFFTDVDALLGRAGQDLADAVLLYAEDPAAAVAQIRLLRGSLPHTPLVAWLPAADMHELGEIMRCGVADCLVSPYC